MLKFIVKLWLQVCRQRCNMQSGSKKVMQGRGQGQGHKFVSTLDWCFDIWILWVHSLQLDIALQENQRLENSISHEGVPQSHQHSTARKNAFHRGWTSWHAKQTIEQWLQKRIVRVRFRKGRSFCCGIEGVGVYVGWVSKNVVLWACMTVLKEVGVRTCSDAGNIESNRLTQTSMCTIRTSKNFETKTKSSRSRPGCFEAEAKILVLSPI